MRALEQRLADCVPAGSLELETLLRIARVEVTRDVQTAAISGTTTLRLRMNPDFVEHHCSTDEALLMALLHELAHVISGHTGPLAGRGLVDNIVFDAIINARLSRRYREARYVDFFRELNPSDAFPSVLLRPPPGWSATPTPVENDPPGLRAVMAKLYPPDGACATEPTYAEVRALFLVAGPGLCEDQLVLVGTHDGHVEVRGEVAGLAAAALEAAVGARWGAMLPGDGGPTETARVALARAEQRQRRVFVDLVRWAAQPGIDRLRAPRADREEAATGQSPLLTPRDRTRAARLALGFPALLFPQTAPMPRPRMSPPSVSRVYLDVSGSMAGALPLLCGLLEPFVTRQLVTAHQFSTTVSPLSHRDLRQGRLTTTFGTSINCVLADIAAEPTVRRALIVTDGFVDTPDSELVRALNARGVQLKAAIDEGGSDVHLRQVASVVRLPASGRRPTRSGSLRRQRSGEVTM